jgi:class 3 adenylate cyclase/TolB-like protein/ketosteroid isomerase-like protein
MAPDEAYTRRICAILLGDVTGYSALVGADDERAARAVEQLQRAVRAIVTDAKGYAESRAGDAIFASFDSVVAAVQTALTIQRRVAAEEFAGQRLQLRIGVNFGDVLVRAGASLGEGVGDAINIAARLQALARPGTVCISEGVYLQVGKKFDETFIDLGNQQLKNIPYPVRAYLMVPRNAAAEHGHTRRPAIVRWGAAAAALVALALTATLVVQHWPQAPGKKPPARVPRSPLGLPLGERAPRPAQPVEQVQDKETQIALGVMLFKSSGSDAENDWRREALRDGLNTQLSQLSRVKVYSKEFIDFLTTRKGLTEIEAASQLGIKKMLTGSLVAMGGTLHIETHVVDVPTGVLESSYTTVGGEQDFLDLQNRMALGVIAHLNLPVTEQEKQTLLARQNTNEEVLKMLLEAEGGAAPPPAPATPGRRSALPRWFAPCDLLQPPAFADDGAQAEIRDVLERYRRATEAREIQALAALYSDFPPEQRAAQQKYFENVRDLRVAIENIDIAVVGNEAVVSYTRTDDFADIRTGRPMHVAVRLTKILHRDDGGWRLAGTR